MKTKRIRNKLVYEIYTLGGYYHANYYYLNEHGAIEIYFSYGQVKAKHDPYFSGKTTFKGFLEELRNDGLIVPDSVIRDYRNRNKYYLSVNG